MSNLAERAKGRWRAILPQVGIGKEFLTGKHGPCPMCGGTDRYRWTDLKGSGAYYCSGCGPGSGIDLVMKALGLPFKEAAERIESVIGKAPVEEKQERSDEECKRAMAKLWSVGQPIDRSSPAHRYLTSRGVGMDAYPGCLRSVVSDRFTGMLAKVVSPGGSVSVNVHRTFLTKDGVKTDRKLMAGSLPAGSAIRLFPVGERLGIAEGIETALSASMLFGLPVWSVLNAGNMAAFRPPQGVKELIVFGDNDAKFAGQASAYVCARDIITHCQRMKRDIAIHVRIPASEGTDWNDELRNGRTAA